MKALILAAGLGTRLRPLTEHTPKTLVLIDEKPLLSYHLDSLHSYGVTDVLINTHYLSEKVEDFIAEYRKKVPDMNIKTFFETDLLGSAGTLRQNEEFFSDTEDFLVVYGDNLTDIDYQKIFTYHQEKKGVIAIASYQEEYPEQKGIIEYDDNSKITRFVEKPKPGETTSNYANAGIYVLSKEIFPYLLKLEEPLLDFGFHVFPYLLNKNCDMFIYHMTESLLDIGTPENYTKSQELIKTMSIYSPKN